MASIIIEKRDVYWSYIGNFFKLAANIFLLPIMLRYLTDEDLGLWYVFAGIAQFVVLLDFGFAPALSRNISYIWCGAKELKKETVEKCNHGETNYDSFKNILTTCRYIYLALAIVSFVILSTLGSYYILTLDYNSGGAMLSWIIYLLGVVLNLYYSYFTSFLRGVGAIAENNKAGVYSKTVQIVITSVLLLFNWGLLGASIGYFVSGVVLRVYSIKAFYWYEGIGKSLKSCKAVVTVGQCWNTFKIIWHNASKEGLIMISNFLTSQANTLICSSALGLAATGSYGISVQLATVVYGMSNIPYTTYQPKIMEKILKGDNNCLTIFSGALLLMVTTYIMLSLVVVVSLPIIIWLKPTFSVDYSMMTILLVFMLIDNFYHLFASYISNFNILPYTYPFVVSSLCSVLLSFLLVSFTDWGIWALIWAPIIVALAYNAWRWPLYVLRDNSMNMWNFMILGASFVKSRIVKIGV